MDRIREPLPTRVEDTAPLPDAFDDELRRGLAELGLDLSPAAHDAIDGHVRLLLAWNAAINLTALRHPVTIARRHVIDSLTGLAWLRARGIDRVLDIGSGGGFPGLPLAAALPGLRVTLLEPIAKKARFLAAAVEGTGLTGRVEVITARAEDIARDQARRDRWPGVTARAVGSTADLVELAFPLLAPGGSLAAWKRGDLTPELAAARRAVDALGGGDIDVEPVAVPGLAQHQLVVATRDPRGEVPDRYPRQPAVRARRPW